MFASVSLTILIFEHITRLTVEFPAQGLEGREADGLGLAGLEDGQVGQGQVDPLSQFGE